jgi:glutamate formiminotransferase
MALIECVANVSEGRRREVLSACEAAVVSAGARLLDVHADGAHNRSVFTFAGTPDAIERAAVALFEPALAAIDLRTHTGVHPRIGAVDVVPFVPLDGATMADCVAIARRVGAAVAARYHLPVFLYEDAASTPERTPLEHIRRGRFEGLAEKLTRPEWRPDFGPAVPHPSAGATAVGARRLLVAFNVNLATDRLDVARAVARAVRQSSGGLPFVKALGLSLTDRGIVTAEAARHGVHVLESEIIGLVPASALTDEAARAFKVAGWSDQLVLENRLRATEDQAWRT